MVKKPKKLKKLNVPLDIARIAEVATAARIRIIVATRTPRWPGGAVVLGTSVTLVRVTPSSAPHATVASQHRGPSRALLVLTVLIVAANLRPTITALGPILGRVGDDTGLSEGALGLLGALPLLTFGVVSPLVHHLARRFGADRAILGALVVLAVGTLVRSLPGFSGWLWVGTLLLAAAIAVGNVLMPAIVKRDFPAKVPLMTGVYSAVMSGVAALASGIAVPIASAEGWGLALGLWCVPAAIAVGVWSLRLRGGRANRPVVVPAVPTGASSMWKSAVAWQVALVMALQSAVFYLVITWLPTIEASYGVADTTAGWHLFIFQIAGIFAGLAAGPVLHRSKDQRALGVTTAIIMMTAMLGLVLVPSLAMVWIVFAGLSAGASLVVSLTLMSERARTPQDSGRLSGMAQSVGYLIASLGPTSAGLLFERTGSWHPALLMAAGLAAGMGVFVFFAGRDRFTHPE